MRVFLDETACESIRVASVAEAVNAAAILARQRGRTIVDIVVDGRPWKAERIDSVEATAAGRAKEVRLASADPTELVCQAFGDAANALSEVDQLQQTAAEMLQADRATDAMKRLAKALELWGSVHQAVTMGAAMIGLDLSPQRETTEQLTIHLRGMRSALEQRDTVALSDTLLYDLPDVVNQWRALLHTLRERVRESATQAKQGGRKA